MQSPHLFDKQMYFYTHNCIIPFVGHIW